MMIHASLFFKYLNLIHSTIRFTMESKYDNCISFLDINVKWLNNNFDISFIRKKTFSGFGIRYFSYGCKKIKLRTITTLSNRACNVCSCYSFMHVEFGFSRIFVSANGFPSSVVDNNIRSFLDNKISKTDLSPIVNKNKFYFPTHYFDHKSVILLPSTSVN